MARKKFLTLLSLFSAVVLELRLFRANGTVTEKRLLRWDLQKILKNKTVPKGFLGRLQKITAAFITLMLKKEL